VTAVRVHYVGLTLDERTGKPFEWTHLWDEDKVDAHVAKVNAGKMRGPMGERWGSVRAEIVHRPFFCHKTLIVRCSLLARCVSKCRALARRFARRLTWA
jgi:hypothetical protein